MAELQYATLEDTCQWEGSSSGYHYHAQLSSTGAGSGSSSGARNKRLRSEHADLSRALPLHLSSSIWMRAHPARMDAVQILISGPEGTPYMNGLFLFDVFFPQTYPQTAPLVNLRTTGRGSVRFNPNLYNCGKVCLSLLGTWSGNGQAEKWNEASTFLQVLISIQSLILVPEPMYNEVSFDLLSLC